MKRTLQKRLAAAVILALFAAMPNFAAAQSDPAPAPQPQTISQPQQAAALDVASPDDPARPAESSSAQPADSTVSSDDDNAVNRHLVSTFLRDDYNIWTAPFHARNYNSHAMLKYGVPFIVISGALMTTDRYTAHWLPNSRSQVIWSGRVSQIGAPYTLAGFTAGTYLLGRAFHNDHAKETGLLSLEALAQSGIVVTVLKEITQRTRPADVTHGTGWWDGGNSFPSGHAITSFAVASVFAYEYHDHIVVPIAAYSVATLVALSRIGAQEHWASDLFVGSSMGFMIGRYIYKQHHDPELPGSLPVRRSLTARLRPAFDFGSAGPGLYWQF